MRSSIHSKHSRKLSSNKIFWSDLFRLNESKSRDCDYIVSVNFVTFLILWKIGKHDEAKRYIDINRKLIELLLDEDINGFRSESQLSVIVEQSRQTAGKLGGAGSNNNAASRA